MTLLFTCTVLPARPGPAKLPPMSEILRIQEFEIIDTSWNWPDHYQSIGPGIYDTCVTGEGDTQKQAMEDAIAQVIDATDEEAVGEIVMASEDFNDSEEESKSLVEDGEEPPLYYICIRWNPPSEGSGETLEVEVMPPESHSIAG